MAVVSLIFSILAFACGIFALIFKRVGPQGERGATGPQGIQGEVGPKGDIGAQGPKGEDGKNGRNGRNGKNGKDGKDGISVIKTAGDMTGDDIVKLLSSMEVVDLKNAVIKANSFYTNQGEYDYYDM